MTTIFDVAQYILDKMGEISTMKLQKLCYYSQSWSIAWTEDPIFKEDFEAWTNGPVCPDLFGEHQGNFMVNPNTLSRGNPANLDADQKDTIDIVLDFYGHRAPYDLREQTHRESPWKKARMGLPETARSNKVITKESMGEYYGNL